MHVTVENLSDIGEIFVDVAVANTDGGKHRDVYGLTQGSEMWKFDVESGQLVQVAVEGESTAIAALDNCVFGFADAVFYGTNNGEVKSLTGSSLDVKACN